MNQSILLSLILLPTMLAFGQKKIAISATVAPVFTHTSYERRSFYPDSNGEVVEPIFLNGSRWETGYSAGFSAQYIYAPGWSVSAGIWYRQLSMRQSRLALAGEGTTTLRTRTIRIPLLLNFRSSPKRLSPYFSLGTFVDLPMAARVIAARSGESTQHLQLASDGGPIFNLLLGAGVQYQFDRRFMLTAQPIAAYNLGRIGGASTYNPSYELSLLMQVAYTF